MAPVPEPSRGPLPDPHHGRGNVRWLGQDVTISIAGGSCPLVGITWWQATTGEWGGSRILDADEIDLLLAAVEYLQDHNCGDGRGPSGADLAALLDGTLDH